MNKNQQVKGLRMWNIVLTVVLVGAKPQQSRAAAAGHRWSVLVIHILGGETHSLERWSFHRTTWKHQWTVLNFCGQKR